MRAQSLKRTPFSEGRASAKGKGHLTNPYAADSLEYRNFELGRHFAIRNDRGLVIPQATAR